MKKDVLVSCAVASVSLIVASFFHHFLPGLGVVFKPLLWPLAVLPFCVRLRTAAVTAFVVPLLCSAVNGMPTFPVAMKLSASAAIVVSALAIVRKAVHARAKLKV